MRPSPRAFASTLVVLVLAVPLVGCGGGSPASSSSRAATAPPTTSQTTPAPAKAVPQHPAGSPEAKLVARAEAICARANRELAASKPLSAERSEILRVVPGNEAVEMRTAQELRNLQAPASLAHVWSAIVHDRRVLAKQLGTLVAMTENYDTAGVRRLTKVKISLHKSLAATARNAGFVQCAEFGLRRGSGGGGSSRS
jgi:hypothetical protein